LNQGTYASKPKKPHQRNRVFAVAAGCHQVFSPKTRFLTTRKPKKAGFLTFLLALTQYSRKKNRFLTKNFLMVQAPGFIRGINRKSKIENPQAPAFIRGVNLKSKI
jgi:hypothetical protein